MENQVEQKDKNLIDSTEKKKVVNLNFSDENTLYVIANIILVIGIIGAFICSLTIVVVDSGEYHFIEDKVFNPTGFAITIGILLLSIILWASLRVLSNISVSLKEINSK